MDIDELTYKIRGAAFKVYNELGPGLLESIYAEAMAMELNDSFLNFEKECEIPVYYKGENMKMGYRADFVV